MMIDGKTGYLVKEGNSNDIIEKLSILLEDENLAVNMGKEGIKVCQNKNSIGN